MTKNTGNQAPFRSQFWIILSKTITIILNIVMVGIIVTALVAGIVYIFTPKDSDITVILEDVNDIRFNNDDNYCVGSQEYSEPNIKFYVRKPTITTYTFTANDTPINLTIGMKQGDAEINLWSKGGNKAQVIKESLDKEGKSLPITANSLNANLGSRSEIYLTEEICAYEVYFTPRLGSFYINNYIYFPPRDSFTSINTVQSFKKEGQKISIELKDVTWGEKPYEKLVLTFTTNKNYSESGFFISAKGKNFNSELPNGDFLDDEAQITLGQTDVDKITLSQPVGKVSLENDGVFSLESSITYMESLDLILGGDPDDFTKVFRNDYIYAFQDGGTFQIGGLSNNVIWRNQQKIKSPWQSLPIEIQVLLLTTLIGLIGWILREIFVTKNIPLLFTGTHKIMKEAPKGHLVLSLTSGSLIAGQLVKRPNKNNKVYILKNVLVKEKRGWVPVSSGKLEISSGKVDYSYIQD